VNRRPSSLLPREHRLFSGELRGLGPRLLRAVLTAAEPVYRGVMLLRNRLYDRRILSVVRLDRPVVSVGNLSAGGTGKTPVVLWLAQRLLEMGLRAAVLLRGYRARPGGVSDEEALYLDRLGEGFIFANPDRVASGRAALARNPSIDVLLLDDGFQHRRLHRDLDIVLIDATNPFGYGHVHPRGLLREPLSGLRRAHAVVLTRADQPDPAEVLRVESRIRTITAAPIFRARHVISGLLDPDGNRREVDSLRGQSCIAVAAIANPASLRAQLLQLGARLTGELWFPDHHDYDQEDLSRITEAGSEDGPIVVTEKDWVKLRRLDLGALHGRLLRLELTIAFEADGAARLAELAGGAIRSASRPPCGTTGPQN